MKTNTAILFVILSAISISCAKINVATSEEEKTVKFTFQATREQIEPETKTYLMSNGVSIGWNVGDEAAIYLLDKTDSSRINGSATVTEYKDDVATFEATIQDPGKKGTFEMFAVYGTIKASTNIFGITDGSGSRNFRLSVLREQNANEGSFDPRYANCVAHANEVTVEDGVVTIPADLKFYNCFSLVGLKINQNGDKVDSVIFSTDNNTTNSYHLAQHHYLKFTDPDNISVPDFKWSSGLGQSLVMKGQFSNSSYYFVVSPISSAKKGNTLKVTFYNSGSSYVYTKAQISTSEEDKNPFRRGSIFSLNEKGFNIPEISNWKGFQQKDTIIKNDVTEVTVNFKTYDSDKNDWTFKVTDNYSQPVDGASVEVSGTGSEKSLNVTLPVNKSQKNLIYLVTATSKDGNIQGGTISSKITQTKMEGDKVYFGTSWGKSFIDSCAVAYSVLGKKANLGTFEGITIVSSPNTALETTYFKGDMTFYFIAAESGEATMTFAKIKTPKPSSPYAREDTLKKAANFYVNSELRTYICTKEKTVENVTVNLGNVTTGDTIKFQSKGSGSYNYVYYDSTTGKLFDFKKVKE